MTNFEIKLHKWLKENNFTCDVQFDDDFGYDMQKNILYIGMYGYPEVSRWFEQFLYEYGMEYTGIYDPVLCLLHELGHTRTIYNFSEKELQFFNFMKVMTEDERMENAEVMFQYWEMPDEFAANIWAINFINDYINKVAELCEIYRLYWNEV